MTTLAKSLAPGNREDLAALLVPPEGYQLSWALATTYSLDFPTLTAVLLALLEDELDNEELRPDVVLRAFGQLESRVNIFTDRGHITPSGVSSAEARKACGLFDRIVFEVSLEHGRFHPKVWALKFASTEGQSHRGRSKAVEPEPIYRLICGSRNLTHGTSVEIGFAVDGSRVTDLAAPGVECGRNLGHFFARVACAAGRPRGWARKAANELQHVAFPVSALQGVRQVDFLWQWPGERKLSSGLRKGGEALLVAPFLGKGFVANLPFARLTVVSREEELDRVYAGDENRPQHVSFSYLREDAVEGETVRLHAKVLAYETQRSPDKERQLELLIGSANGTNAAWGGSGGPIGYENCEAMIRIAANGRLESVLAAAFPDGFLANHTPPKECVQTPESEVLDRWQDQLASMSIKAEFCESDGSKKIVLRLAEQHTAALRRLLEEGVEAEIGLFACDRTRVELGRLAAPEGIEFTGLCSEEVGEFAVIEMRTVDGLWREFALKIALPDDAAWHTKRQQAVVSAAFGTSAQVHGFLRDILTGGRNLQFESLPSNPPASMPTANRGRGRRAWAKTSEITLEELLSYCSQDRVRFATFRRAVESLEGNEYIGPRFLEFWRLFAKRFDAGEKAASREAS